MNSISLLENIVAFVNDDICKDTKLTLTIHYHETFCKNPERIIVKLSVLPECNDNKEYGTRLQREVAEGESMGEAKQKIYKAMVILFVSYGTGCIRNPDTIWSSPLIKESVPIQQ